MPTMPDPSGDEPETVLLAEDESWLESRPSAVTVRWCAWNPQER